MRKSGWIWNIISWLVNFPFETSHTLQYLAFLNVRQLLYFLEQQFPSYSMAGLHPAFLTVS